MKSENKTITCIACPNGCEITVFFDENGKISGVTGNKCKNGIAYAEAEVTMPTRILTSSVLVDNGDFPLASVKTSKPIPKALMKDAVKALSSCCVSAPVKVGDVVCENILDTGVDVVATCNVNIKQ